MDLRLAPQGPLNSACTPAGGAAALVVVLMARQTARKSGFDFLRPEDVYSDDGDSDGIGGREHFNPLSEAQGHDRPRQTARRSGINSAYDSDDDHCSDQDDVMDTSEASEEGDSDADHDDDDPVYNPRSSQKHAKADRAWKDALWEALQGKAPDSSIACGGRVAKLPFACPAISVEGVGRIALPLCPEQAVTLKEVAQQVTGSPGLHPAHQVRTCSSSSSCAWLFIHCCSRA